MLIQTLPLAEAVGHLLLHNVADSEGRKLLAKGTRLTEAQLALLRAAGHESVAVAVLEIGDVHEDEAAARIAGALVDGAGGLRLTRAVAGRVNLHSEANGVLYVDATRLTALNALSGITLATRSQHTLIGPAFETTQLATLKVIPYALSERIIAEALPVAAGTLRVAPLRPQRVALLITAEVASAARIQNQFEPPTRARLERLGSTLAAVERALPDEEGIAEAAARLLAQHDALIIGGQTSIMDRADTTLQALERVGAGGILHGAPVEPGNLLALAYHGSRWILGAPGCAKSLDHNIVDLVLPRLLVGERLGMAEIAALGLGGLL